MKKKYLHKFTLQLLTILFLFSGYKTFAQHMPDPETRDHGTTPEERQRQGGKLPTYSCQMDAGAMVAGAINPMAFVLTPKTGLFSGANRKGMPYKTTINSIKLDLSPASGKTCAEKGRFRTQPNIQIANLRPADRSGVRKFNFMATCPGNPDLHYEFTASCKMVTDKEDSQV